jgi:Phage integrase family
VGGAEHQDTLRPPSRARSRDGRVDGRASPTLRRSSPSVGCPDAFVFSLDPDGTTPRRPESVTQRYRRMCKQIGVRTTIHKLRHYSATELILAGVDIRTVAGRLGHAGGGATTLRTYAAWVSEGDQRAAREIAARMPSRAGPRPLIVDIDPRTAYERMAISLRDQILDGTLLPRTTDTNDQAVGSHVRRVRSDGEARRGPAVGLGVVQVTPGQRTLVRGFPLTPQTNSRSRSETMAPPTQVRQPSPRPARDHSISKCVTLAEWSTVSTVLPTPTTRQHCTACLSTRSDERGAIPAKSATTSLSSDALVSVRS